jgi:hypothetical protein
MAWDWTVDDIAEVTFIGSLYNQLTMTVLHFRPSLLTTTDGGTAAADLLDKLIQATEHWDKYRACLSNDWKGQGITIQRVADERMRNFFFPRTEIGLINVSAGTGNTNGSLEKYTELATKKKVKHAEGQVGRIAVPALPQSVYSEGNLTDAFYVGPMQLLANKVVEVVTTALGNEWTPILWHRKGVSKKYDDVTGCTPKRTVRVIRRRTVGVGK